MELFYRKYGSGPPLIILHGLFGSSDNWTSIAKKLADSFTVILPDIRNHGQSPHSEIHDYNSMAEDIHELAERIAINKFFLAGHSMGGKTAVQFALKWPEMLYGLLVADISPFRTEDEKRTEYRQHEKILQIMLNIDLTKISSRQEVAAILENQGLPERTTAFVLKNLQRTTDKHFIWKINAQSVYRNIVNILKGIDRNNAYSLQVTGFPVIFLKGSESDYLPAEDYKDIIKVFPATEFFEINDAGHWLHSDKPDEVIRCIKKLTAV
ncbi:MAG TPA: alpha/beta fold hydrolase [Bacteroidales bacterium]|nr:alpha/beta fold hydrolase [Bacteroidales bacterium]